MGATDPYHPVEEMIDVFQFSGSDAEASDLQVSKMIIGIFLIVAGVLASTFGGFLVRDAWQQLNARIPASIALNFSTWDEKLHIVNKGGPASELRLFVTHYWLDQDELRSQRIVIERYNKIGGSLFSRDRIGLNEEVTFDANILGKYEAVSHADVEPTEASDREYYAYRVEYVDVDGARKHQTAFSYVNLDIKSPVANFRESAVGGSTKMDWRFRIPDVLEEHQETLF